MFAIGAILYKEISYFNIMQMFAKEFFLYFGKKRRYIM